MKRDETSRDSEILALTQLGLTICQANVLLALLQNGTCSAKAIADFSNIAREKVYQTIPTLQKLGLLERKLAKPVLFKAVPIKEAISILLQRKDKEHSELRKTARDLLYDIAKHESTVRTGKDESQFTLIPPNKASLTARKIATEKAQKNINVATSSKRFLQMMNMIEEEFEEAVEKGVKCRFLIYGKGRILSKDLHSILKKICKLSSLELRYINRTPRIILGIIDEEQASMVTEVDADFLEAPTLWSTSKALIIIIQDYFEMLWQKANVLETNLE